MDDRVSWGLGEGFWVWARVSGFGDPLSSSPKLLLKLLYQILVQHERLSKNIRINWRVRSKHGISNGNDSGILAPKAGESQGGSLSDIELEVNHSYGEDEDVSLVEKLSEESVTVLVRRNEPHVQRSLSDEQDFRGTRGAKSIRARDIPSVLSPGRLSTNTAVTLEPTALSVFPGMLIPEKKKSSAFTISGFLQNLPFTNTVTKTQ
ncbi:hypothetical protein F8388_012726 [Cannabis sativa]|uniref:Uncharacterized protein n=1 Tax=Cannabis sativa TaxID=3483 RepID=A0A7J6GQS8_CANSA|nr:hypothetical protein G4B88_028523 [Cannabis sativa]KAF4392270.1 hypothetical protein F8388_012726 [Cannabis sativa]